MCPVLTKVSVPLAVSDHVSPSPAGNTTQATPPGPCESQWSAWINRDDPSGDGDHELWTAVEMANFCPGL